MKISNLLLDLKKIELGAWMKHPSGAEFKIARNNNTRQREMIKKLKAELGKKEEDFTEADRMAMSARVLASTVLLDWRGLDDEDENGKDVPYEYTSARSLLIFQDKEWEEVALWIINRSLNVDSYFQSDEKKDAKNS